MTLYTNLQRHAGPLSPFAGAIAAGTASIATARLSSHLCKPCNTVFYSISFNVVASGIIQTFICIFKFFKLRIFLLVPQLYPFSTISSFLKKIWCGPSYFPTYSVCNPFQFYLPFNGSAFLKSKTFAAGDLLDSVKDNNVSVWALTLASCHHTLVPG